LTFQVIQNTYTKRRDYLVNDFVGSLEHLITNIHKTLKFYNLPIALQALEEPLKLISTPLVDMQEIKTKLQLSFADIARLKNSID